MCPRGKVASNFSRRIFHEECFKAEVVKGAPKYSNRRTAIENPRMQAIAAWVIIGVWKKNIWDLDLLIIDPEASEKSTSKDLS